MSSQFEQNLSQLIRLMLELQLGVHLPAVSGGVLVLASPPVVVAHVQGAQPGPGQQLGEVDYIDDI